MTNEDLQKIVIAGTFAPSGSNSQPWEFRITDDGTIETFATPEKDHPILNFRNRGTWIAHGALIENMAVMARATGYEPRVRVFPDAAQPDLTARITFSPASKNSDEDLAAAIRERATDRKPYKELPLTEAEKNAIETAAAQILGASMVLAEDPSALHVLAKAVSVTELVTLEDRELHRLFVKEIAWSAEEEKRRGGGLYLKTMELAPPQEFVLSKVLRHWGAMRAAKRIGFAKKIADGNAKGYAQASAIGAIVVPDGADGSFVDAGRLLERVWLRATALGLRMHPITGILFMHMRVQSGDPFGLSDAHVTMINEAYDAIRSCFPTGGGIAFLFRIGHGAPPSARSIKNPPVFRP